MMSPQRRPAVVSGSAGEVVIRCTWYVRQQYYKGHSYKKRNFRDTFTHWNICIINYIFISKPQQQQRSTLLLIYYCFWLYFGPRSSDDDDDDKSMLWGNYHLILNTTRKYPVLVTHSTRRTRIKRGNYIITFNWVTSSSDAFHWNLFHHKVTQDSFNFNSIKLHSLLTENNYSLYSTANSRFFGWPWYVPFLDRTDVSTIRHPFSFKLSQTYYDCTFLSINKRRSELIQESTTRLDRQLFTDWLVRCRVVCRPSTGG